MSIKCNLSTLMGKHKMTIQDVCNQTGLARNTVSFLYHEKQNAISFKTLMNIWRTKKMNPLIKWPGGKSSEIKQIKHLIPEFNRYVEPFFGGGALYFYLKPQNAAINDISETLMDYYSLLKIQDKQFLEYLNLYNLFLQGSKIRSRQLEKNSNCIGIKII